jgi:DNA-binding Xre family transcriptional regulator
MLTGRKKITIVDFITICKALNVSANDIINPKEEKNKAS